MDSPGSVATRFRDTRAKWANNLPLWLFVLLLSLYLLTAGGQLFISDGEVMFLQTRAILRDHTLAIGSNAPASFFIVGWDGLRYGKYDLGQPLAAIPFYIAGWTLSRVFPKGDEGALTVFSVSLLPQVATALSGLILYKLGVTLFRSQVVATGITLLWATGTLAWPYSKIYFPEALVTLLLLLSFWLFAEARRRDSNRGLVFAGAALGSAVSVRLTAAVYLPAFIAYLCLENLRGSSGIKSAIPRGIARALLFSVGILPAVGLLLWHNYVRFHSVWLTGYQNEGFSTPLNVGLYGLLFSPGRGLFLFSPLILLGLVSLESFRKHFPAITVFIMTASVTVLGFYGQWWAWHGGFSWGPRFLVPLIPFLLLPMGEKLTSRRFLMASIIVWALSLLVIIPGISVDFHRYFTDSIFRDNLSEDSLWFEPWHSQILVQWRYLLSGYAISFGGNHLSDFGMPRILNFLYIPLTGLVFLLSLGRVALICLPEFRRAIQFDEYRI